MYPKHALLLLLLASWTGFIYSWINHKPVDLPTFSNYCFTSSKDYTAENTEDSKLVFCPSLSKDYKSAKTSVQ